MAANNEAQRRGDDGAKDGDAKESQFATPTSTALGWCVWRPGSALFLHAPSALGGWSLNCAHTVSKSAAVVIVLAVLGWALGLRRPWTVDGWRGFLRKLLFTSEARTRRSHGLDLMTLSENDVRGALLARWMRPCIIV